MESQMQTVSVIYFISSQVWEEFGNAYVFYCCTSSFALRCINVCALLGIAECVTLYFHPSKFAVSELISLFSSCYMTVNANRGEC